MDGWVSGTFKECKDLDGLTKILDESTTGGPRVAGWPQMVQSSFPRPAML